MTTRKTCWLVVTMLIALLGLTACSEQTTDTAAQEAKIEVAEVRLALESSLERAEARLEDLEEAYEAAEGQAREELDQTLDELRHERAELAMAVKGLRYETAATFEAAQNDLRARMNDLEDALVEARFWTIETRADLEATLQGQLDQADEQAAALERRMAEVGDDARSAYREMLREVRAERDALAAQYERLETATEEELREMRRDLARASASLERTLRNAAEDVETFAENSF